MSYSDDSLRQLLALRDQPDGVLSTDQKQALILWEQTPDQARRELEAELRERGPAPVDTVAPLTPREREELRSKGLLEEEAPATASLLDRIRSFVRRS
jgi:hypothetical protein